MNCIKYGYSEGIKVVYFHGVPGAPQEAGMLESLARQHRLNIICPNRFSISPALKGEAYFRRLAQTIDERVTDEEVVLVGFSIGTYVALATSQYLKTPVQHMHLISSAAPIDSGDFLADMAGGAVFKTAQNSPLVFKLMVAFQRLLAILSPRLLYRMLFASATGQDKTLSQDAIFQERMVPLLKKCFVSYASGYVRDISAYAKPWGISLERNSIPVSLWHGTEDNWSPLAMARYLDRTLACSQGIHAMQGLSHYSCLQRASAEIFAQLNE